MLTSKFKHRLLESPLFVTALSIGCVTSFSTCADSLDMSSLLNMDIRELMEVPVTLASRTQNQQFSTPAASYVITREDIQRSGLRSIPELLRLVPGLNVGKIDSSKWAIDSRSGASQFSSSMLVMMDNRILYSPLFGGTYWEVQDTLLEDIERIEVIRGAGGSLWGANASNGVVNIVTRHSQDTTGTYTQAAIGDGEIEHELAYREGFNLGNSSTGRVYIKQRNSGPGEYLSNVITLSNGLQPGNDAHDGGLLSQFGFRFDLKLSSRDTLNIQGDYNKGKLKDTRISELDMTADNDIDTVNANLLTRWDRTINANQSLNLTVYYDQAERESDAFIDNRQILDAGFQHNLTYNNHQFSWGLEYRHTHDRTGLPDNQNSFPARLALDPPRRHDQLIQIFMQDQVGFYDDTLMLTLGTRIENNDYTGNEYQPNLRLAFLPDNTSTYWMSLSRSVRTPTRGESDLYIDFNDSTPLCGIIPNTTLDPELGCIQSLDLLNQVADITKSLELGLRKQLSENSLLDISTYYNEIENTTFTAELDGEEYGYEIDYRYNFTDSARLSLWYARCGGDEDDESGLEPTEALVYEESAHLRLYWDINSRWQLDTLAYYGSKLRDTNGNVLAEPLRRLDFHIGWQATKAIKLNAYFLNINEDVHREAAGMIRLDTGVPRSVLISAEASF